MNESEPVDDSAAAPSAAAGEGVATVMPAPSVLTDDASASASTSASASASAPELELALAPEPTSAPDLAAPVVPPPIATPTAKVDPARVGAPASERARERKDALARVPSDDAPMHYTVLHDTDYYYEAPVVQSWQLARLVPRLLAWQTVQSHALDIEPTPEERHEGPDSFGNTVTHFSLYGAHRRLAVRMRCEIDVQPRPSPQTSLAWEQVRDAVRDDPRLDDLNAARMCEPTMLVPWSEGARRYAARQLTPGRPWLEALRGLTAAIHRDFKFQPGVTTVSTSVDEVLHQRRGVCQDFAHLMLACLRGHGLPARYVSGYLLTDPPPGQARLLGVDASHAWVAAYAPDVGWVEFDPTNDTLADTRYITLAWGADFADVVPLRGVILGGGEQQLDVSVSVIPQE